MNNTRNCDPLLEEAREIVAKYFDERGNSRVAEACRSGNCDTTGTLQMTIEGLRRGIELGKACADLPTNPVQQED